MFSPITIYIGVLAFANTSKSPSHLEFVIRYADKLYQKVEKSQVFEKLANFNEVIIADGPDDNTDTVLINLKGQKWQEYLSIPPVAIARKLLED